MPPAPPQHVNLFFRLLTVATALFIITLLAIIATLIGDPAAAKSPVELFLNAYGWWMCGVEVLAILIFGIAAMVLDSRQSARFRESEHEASALGSVKTNEGPSTEATESTD